MEVWDAGRWASSGCDADPTPILRVAEGHVRPKPSDFGNEVWPEAREGRAGEGKGKSTSPCEEAWRGIDRPSKCAGWDFRVYALV